MTGAAGTKTDRRGWTVGFCAGRPAGRAVVAAAGLAAVGGLAGGLVTVCAKAEADIKVAAPSRTTETIFFMGPP